MDRHEKFEADLKYLQQKLFAALGVEVTDLDLEPKLQLTARCQQRLARLLGERKYSVSARAPLDAWCVLRSHALTFRIVELIVDEICLRIKTAEDTDRWRDDEPSLIRVCQSLQARYETDPQALWIEIRKYIVDGSASVPSLVMPAVEIARAMMRLEEAEAQRRLFVRTDPVPIGR